MKYSIHAVFYFLPDNKKLIILFQRNPESSLILFLFSISVEAQDVYKTRSGAKYHLATCRTVKNVSEKITISEAKEMGLEPCKICKPQFAYSSGSSTKKAQGQSTTVQCSGTTKAGTRCRHMTRIASGYCFQHQPK